ncbi:hypothetical protein [Streptomyces cahuitamycinicus]|nr:hypothetical protein [Streptomyces cahuitamycinicus]
MVQDRTSSTWSCEVTGHATYAVTQEPHIVAGIRSSPGYKEHPRVAGHQVSGFDTRHVVADCAGTPTYFSIELGQDYTSAIGESSAPRTKDLFENFVDVAGKRLGCNAHWLRLVGNSEMKARQGMARSQKMEREPQPKDIIHSMSTMQEE